MRSTQKKFLVQEKLMNTGIIDVDESVHSPKKNFRLKNMQNTVSNKKLMEGRVKRQINDYSVGVGKYLKMA